MLDQRGLHALIDRMHARIASAIGMPLRYLVPGIAPPMDAPNCRCSVDPLLDDAETT